MLTCKYNLNLNGQNLEFDTIESLHDFIENNTERISASMNGADIIFSKNLDLQSETLAKITEFEKNKKNTKIVFENGIKKDVVSIPGYTGTTSFLDTLKDEYGNNILQTFDKDAFRKREILRLEESYLSSGLTPIEATNRATQEVDNTIASWNTITENGTAVHKMAEIFFRDSSLDLKELYEQETGLEFPFNDDVLDATIKAFNKIKDTIYAKDPQMTILTEVPIHNESDDPTKKIMGIVDLMAIDSEGKVHIYDFKTSFKEMEAWDADKTKRHMYQLSVYKQILNNQGIAVSSLNIAPLIMESTDLDRKEVTSISNPDGLPVDNLGLQLYNKYANIRQLVSGLFPSKVAKISQSKNSRIAELQELFFDVKPEEDYKMRIETFRQLHVKKDTDGNLFFMDGYNKIKLSGTKNDDYLIKTHIQKNDENKREIAALVKENIKSLIADSKDNPAGSVDEINPMRTYTSKTMTNYEAREMRAASLAFKTYMNQQWEIVDIESLEQEGILTFRHFDTGRFDFVIMSHDDLEQIVPLKKGKNIFGNFYTDNNPNIHNNRHDASRLNLEAIKVLSFINDNVDLFTEANGNIGMIRGYDIGNQVVHAVNVEPMKNVFRDLSTVTDTPSKIHQIKSMSPASMLASVVTNTLDNTKYLGLSNLIKGQLQSLDKLMKGYDSQDRQTILNELIKLKRDVGSKWVDPAKGLQGIQFDLPLHKVYLWLNATISDLSGRPTMFEAEDMVEYGLTNSTMASTLNEISVTTVQQALEPIRNAMNKLTENYVKFKSQNSKMFETFYKEQGVSKALGNYVVKYQNLFERTSDGKLDQSFRFKNPNDMSNDLNKTERQFIKDISRKINDMFYGYDDAQHASESASDPNYYNIPISPANGESRLWAHGISTKSVTDYIKNNANDVFGLSNLFDDQRKQSREDSNMMQFMYDKFNISKNPSDRQSQIDKVGVESLETNLEVLFGDLYYTQARKKVYDNILPVVHATLVSSYLYNTGYTSKDPRNMYDFIEKYVKTTLFEEKLLEPHQENLFKTLSGGKHIVSMFQLGVAPLNLVRESLQGYMTNVGRIWAKQYGEEETPSLSDYHKAIKMMVSDSPDFVKNVTLIEELNHMYRMADMDVNRLPERMKISKTGVSQFFSRWMLWFQSAPDYVTRMSFLLAKMIKDGSFDAHTMVDGELRYDWKKDNRFKAFADGDTNNENYNFQKQHYLAMLKDSNDEVATTGMGAYLNDDESKGPLGDITKAYTSKERDSIKAFINYSHGSYDHGDGILFQNTLFGVMFMQFRTWFLAKKSQWWMKNDKYVIGGYRQLKNIKGERLYKHIDDAGAVLINTDDTGDPVVEWQGKYMEGILQSMIRSFKMLGDTDLSLMDRLRNVREDEVIKGNLKMVQSDLSIYILLGMLINGLIPWDEMKEDNKALTAILQTGFYATNDLFIYNTVEGILDPDGMFPTISAGFGVINGAYDGAFGNFSFNNFLYDNFAAARTYQKLF